MIGVKPDGKRLAEIGKMIDDDKLRPLVQEVLPLEHAKKALELSRSRHVGGKIVLSISPITAARFRKMARRRNRERDPEG